MTRPEDPTPDFPRPKDTLFRVERRGAVLIVSPLVNIVSLLEDQVRREISALVRSLDDAAIEHLVFDFAHIAYFGSSMLEAMRTLWMSARDRSGRLAVCNCTSVVREILARSRLDTIWTICDTREEALIEVGRDTSQLRTGQLRTGQLRTGQPDASEDNE